MKLHLLKSFGMWLILFVGFLAIVAPRSGDEGIDSGLTGSHCVLLKGENMSPAYDALVNSQDIEDEATASGGFYEVYSDTVDLENVHDIYQLPLSKMLAETERPLWYLFSDETDISTIEVPDPDIPTAVARIREVRGAR